MLANTDTSIKLDARCCGGKTMGLVVSLMYVVADDVDCHGKLTINTHDE